MKGFKLLNLFSFLYVSLVFLLLICCAKCETYTVGDEDQWSTGINYLFWSEKYNFRVDDIIVFKYIEGQHNVYEVTEDTYRSCNASSGVLAKYDSGNDQIKLTEAKEYWFICDIPGHCLGGMRFGVNVTEASTTETDATPPSSSNNNSASKGETPIIYFVLFALFLKIISCC